jgi:hypothetical protein
MPKLKVFVPRSRQRQFQLSWVIAMEFSSVSEVERRSQIHLTVRSLPLVGAFEGHNPTSLHSSFGMQARGPATCLSQELPLEHIVERGSSIRAISIHVDRQTGSNCPLCILICSRLPECRTHAVGPLNPTKPLASIHFDGTLDSVYIRNSQGKRCGRIRLVCCTSTILKHSTE